MLNRRIPPKISMVEQLPFQIPEKVLLKNQAPVYFLHGSADDIVKIDLLFMAGSYNQNKPLVAFATANLLQAGTSGKTSRQIAELFDFYGAYLQIETQKDTTMVSVTVLTRHLIQVLNLLGEMLKGPVFPNEEVATFTKNQKSKHLVNARKVEHLARIHFNEKIFGSGHPYGYRLRSADFDNVRSSDLMEFYLNWFHPGNLLVIVSGNPPAHLNGLLEEHFSDNGWLKPVTDPVQGDYPFPETGPGKVFISRKGSLQSAIRIGKRTITRPHPDYHRLIITNALLGGYFGSRLMRNIRQDKGFTYGIYSTLVSLVRDGYFFVGTQVGADVCKSALEQIYLELYHLRTQPASAEELDNLKNHLAGQHMRLFDGPFAKADRLRELLVFGLDNQHHASFLTVLKNITPDIIMETAGKYLNENSMTEVVVGK